LIGCLNWTWLPFWATCTQPSLCRVEIISRLCMVCIYTHKMLIVNNNRTHREHCSVVRPLSTPASRQAAPRFVVRFIEVARGLGCGSRERSGKQKARQARRAFVFA